MLNKETYMILLLLVIALYAIGAAHSAAQTIGCMAYGPSPYGCGLTCPTSPELWGRYPVSLPGSSAPAPTATPTPAPVTATVHGTVAYSNGTAVAGAIVRLQGPSGTQYSTTSGKDGHFEISNVQQGPYTFSYTYGSYSSPATTLAVNADSVKQDVSLPALAEGTPVAIDHSAMQSWYATYYTPPVLSNRSVVYDPAGHIIKVITGNPCQAVEVPVSGH